MPDEDHNLEEAKETLEDHDEAIENNADSIEVLARREQEREEYIENEHAHTRGFTASEHETTREEMHERFDTLEEKIGGYNPFERIYSWFSNIGDRDTEDVDIDIDRRKAILGTGAVLAIDYTNIIPGDKDCGDELIGGRGWDLDIGGLYGEQRSCDQGSQTDEAGLNETNTHSVDGVNYVSGSTFGGSGATVDSIVENYDVERLEEINSEVDSNSYNVRISEADEVEVLQDGDLIYNEQIDGIFADAYHDGEIDGDTNV